MRDKDAQKTEGHHGIEEIGVQVVARLQEILHGTCRGEKAVAEQGERPDQRGRLFRETEHLHEVKREGIADPDEREHDGNEDERGDEDGHLPAVDAEAEQDRLGDKEQRGRRDGGIRHERTGDLPVELCDDEDKRRPAEKQEHDLAGLSENRTDHRAD